MDLLTDIIQLLRPQGVLWKPFTANGHWGMSVPSRKIPRFCLVVAGRCWFLPPKGRGILMQKGDYLLLTTSERYTLASDNEVNPALTRLIAKAGDTEYVHWNDRESTAKTKLVGGYFQVTPQHTELMSSLLPERIFIRASDQTPGRLTQILNLIGNESECDLPGRQLMMSRLVDIMLVEVLRRSMQHMESQQTGWLSGLADPRIAQAMWRIHADVAQPWTVAKLAEQVGMSRSVFARRFAERVGVAPATYLSNWRIALAKNALLHSDRSISDVALGIGYQSDSAFSSAFSRLIGCSPKRYRDAGRKQTHEKVDQPPSGDRTTDSNHWHTL